MHENLDCAARTRSSWIEGVLQRAELLLKARRHHASDAEFGGWLREERIEINSHTRAALLQMAAHPAETRAALEATESWDIRRIWENEISPGILPLYGQRPETVVDSPSSLGPIHLFQRVYEDHGAFNPRDFVHAPDPRQEEIAAANQAPDGPRKILSSLLSQGKHCPPEILQAAKEEVEKLDAREEAKRLEKLTHRDGPFPEGPFTISLGDGRKTTFAAGTPLIAAHEIATATSSLAHSLRDIKIISADGMLAEAVGHLALADPAAVAELLDELVTLIRATE